MNTVTPILILRALLLGASFTGLCAAIRTGLKLDRMIAPFTAACTIILTLMLTGMAGFLQAGFVLLYAGGFAGLIYAYVVRRARPEFGIIGLLVAYAAALCLRFWNCPLYHIDDFTHWGLVARTILNADAFPSAATPIITFQSYPAGTASFIYYVCRTLENREDLYVIAQLFLTGLAFLPLLAHIRKNRRYLYPAALAVYLYLLQRNHAPVNLQVDWLLPILGLGGVAGVLFYRNDLRRAALIAFLAAAATVYIKSSGVFFAACTVAMLIWAARRQGVRGRKLFALALGSVAVVAGAYLLWSLRVKLAYPAGFESKHAVSLSAYASELTGKGADTVLRIASAMVAFLLHPNSHILTAWLMFIAFAAALTAGCMWIPGQRRHLKPVMKALAAIAGSYLIWFVSLFFMYLFSMPEKEALQLASIARYNSTGLQYLMSLSALLLFAFYGREDLAVSKALRRFMLAGSTGCVAVIVALLPVSNSMQKWYLEKDTELIPVRSRLAAAREAAAVAPDSKVMTFIVDGADDRSMVWSYYHAKYALDTADLITIASGKLPDSDEALYARYYYQQPLEMMDDPIEFVAAQIDDCDAFVIIDYEPGFDARMRAFLETYEGDTPVVFSYDKTDN